MADDYPQWGRKGSRNNVVEERGLAVDWHPGKFDRKTGKWDAATAKNIKWVAPLGSQTYGTPVIADGRVFVGTNNSAAYLPRYPRDIDLGCLLCFRERDGAFLWQFSAEKLPTGRVHDWPLMGIASSPLVEQDRAWFVSNRGEVVCVDTQGYYDDEDDGPEIGPDAKLFELHHEPEAEAAFQAMIASLDDGELPTSLRERFEKSGTKLPAKIELAVENKGKRWSFTAKVGDLPREFHLIRQGPYLRSYMKIITADKHEADVVWRFDMMKKLGSSQHNLATCCITSWKDTLFICTGNGVADDHMTIPAPDAPSFFAMNKHTGEVLWTSNLPGANIHHGQWSAPAVGLLGGVPQVVFCGGDGWVYSFHAEEWKGGKPRLLWRFDTNAKDAVLELGGRGTRNEPIAPPVLHENRVYVTTGQDPEHGEGRGCIWCIDATEKLDGSDVSKHKVVDKRGNVMPHRRVNNAPQWRETRLWGDGFDRELDKGVINEQIRGQIQNRNEPLAAPLAVKALTPGAEWELKAGSGDSQETLYVWKRWRVSEQGVLDQYYVAARPVGSRIIENPDSAAVWKYDSFDWNSNGKIDDFYEDMHRSLSSVVIHGDLLFCGDGAGLLHCLDMKSGKRNWICDQLAMNWGTPLIADGRLFVGDEDGDVSIFHLFADPAKAGKIPPPDPEDKDPYPRIEPIWEINMLTTICCNPVAANGVLYITTKDHLFAIETKKP
ncbi:MAG: PQQ-binding-like beta-propeller repeat protein [Pirellulaceae bacterium]